VKNIHFNHLTHQVEHGRQLEPAVHCLWQLLQAALSESVVVLQIAVQPRHLLGCSTGDLHTSPG
jgi:hypothetical protein